VPSQQGRNDLGVGLLAKEYSSKENALIYKTTKDNKYRGFKKTKKTRNKLIRQEV